MFLFCSFPVDNDHGGRGVHTESWGPGAGDNFLTKCCDKTGQPDGTVGPIDPSIKQNYQLMMTLLGSVFHIHYTVQNTLSRISRKLDLTLTHIALFHY